jgi:hypothetical protein
MKCARSRARAISQLAPIGIHLAKLFLFKMRTINMVQEPDSSAAWLFQPLESLQETREGPWSARHVVPAHATVVRRLLDAGASLRDMTQLDNVPSALGTETADWYRMPAGLRRIEVQR